MSAKSINACVRSYASIVEFEQRHGERHSCQFDATMRPLEARDSFSWGASVRDVSSHGIGLTLCYPFRSGTYLALELGKTPNRQAATLLTRVVHAREQADGTWHLGCEFVKPLSQQELEALV